MTNPQTQSGCLGRKLCLSKWASSWFLSGWRERPDKGKVPRLGLATAKVRLIFLVGSAPAIPYPLKED